MSKVSITSLIAFSAALAACSNDTNRALTSPDIAPAFSATSADLGASYTLDGPSDAAFMSLDAFAGMAGAQSLGAQLAASTQAASGSHASGHVGFPAGVLPPASQIASEQYSFVALSTASAIPLSAKGQFEVTFTSVTGGDIKIHGDVVCMITFGNTARVSGQITKVWRNNVPSPITANTHAFWVVVDNGAGAATPDQVSLMRFSPAAVAQSFCTNGFGSVVFPNQVGNVQVR
ncbi:MAG TPA: hypothetical protein VE869_17940 [Gemmatimonas sp.]|nr:hypothetical protein [Gemmatimonas sp.]